MINVSVDVASSTPPYEQLVDQLTRLIVGGHVAVGQRLPAIRQLAGDLGLAPGTVGRAYSMLERDGLVRSRRPNGTFVAGTGAAGARQRDLLQQLAERFTDQARQLGVDREEAVRALQTAYRRAGSTTA
jgi:DNA-binding transcriptional regulator YhcF (GntR family)